MKGESDQVCAEREFWEETNIPSEAYEIVPNMTFTEIFTGTNDIKYKHIYFIALLKNSSLIGPSQKLTAMQKREISAVSWKTLKQSKTITRPHYTERKKILDNLEREIQRYRTV
jgi:8-oxo-dGTP pyrophosphatase MutT (NUDIX family)